MTKEELDALNEQGRLWRARNKPAQGEQAPADETTATGMQNASGCALSI